MNHVAAGKFKLIRKIGKGTFSDIYLGTQFTILFNYSHSVIKSVTFVFFLYLHNYFRI
jgi:hypothetical protein